MLSCTGLLSTTSNYLISTRSCRCVSSRVTPTMWNSQTVRKFDLKKHPQGTEIKAGLLMSRWITNKNRFGAAKLHSKSMKHVKLNNLLEENLQNQGRSCILSGHHNAPDESVDSYNGSNRGRDCTACPFVEASYWKFIETGDLTPKGISIVS